MIAQLKTCTLFGPLDDEALQPLATIAATRTLAAREWLFRAGEEAEAIYIVLDGELAVMAEQRGRAEQLAVLRTKDAVAEAALLEPYVHGSSAQALTVLTLLELPAKKARSMLRENASAATAILRQVARTMYRRMRYQGSRRWGLVRTYDRSKTRREHDLLGELDVPEEALFGIQTLRATQNFDITGIKLSHFPRFLVALGMVKQACARANHQLGLLDAPVARAIDVACQELIEGRWHGHFVVDMVQGGAGTSTNMNANEVLANRALELLGHERGQYEFCHPNNHVNLGQSTNDVYPTAIRLAIVDAAKPLGRALADLKAALHAKAAEFKDVLKMGRTQLQDAVPMTLAQELEAFASTTGEDIERLGEAARLFWETSLGGTAIGTGINADPEYAPLVLNKLREISGIDLEISPNLVEATPDTGAFVSFSGVLKRIAVKLSKLCNDLRLLSSGPRCGFGEINLPPMQPGSSIMPGKVNPVIPEVVNQIAFQVIGNDLTITLAAEAGQLQLNVMEPIIVFNIFQSMEMLSAGMNVLIKRCIEGITANRERCRELVENSIGIVTALVPALGYERAGDVAKAALQSGRSVREIVLERGYLAEEVLDDLLSVDKMTAPRRLA